MAQFGRRALALLMVCASAAASDGADAALGREAQLSAAYIFNFMKFVEWPAHAHADALHVCFVGAHHVRDALAAATADKAIGARRIVVRSIGDPQSAARCQVVYFDEHAELAPNALDPAATLTIGERADFTGEGGIIQLYTERHRLRFAINVHNAKRAGLSVSSNLLQLATRIEQGPKQ